MIPTGPGVTTSTVQVSGAGAYLADLDVLTNITHTFAADMDISLTSPSGTVVTLSTDNGAGNDDVFDGTRWDDDANPGGSLPYTTNDGVVTDHAYVNTVAATPLAPEEGLGAFIGENPNGTWTLTVSDDLAGEGGSIDQWSLELSTLPAAPELTKASATSTVPVEIPTGPGVAISTVQVSGAGAYLADLDVLTNITHFFAADMDISLISPSGTVVTLSTDNGAGNDDVFDGTRWDDDANPGGSLPYTTNAGLVTDHPYTNLVAATPLAPEEGLGAFIGENPNGTWTLTVSDDLAGEGGSIDQWSLEATAAACKQATTVPPVVPPDAKCERLEAKVAKAKRRLAKARQARKLAQNAFAQSGGNDSARRAVKRARTKVKVARRKLKAAKAAAKDC